MKKQIPQYLMIFALLMVIAIGLPSSFAKYASSKEYTVNLSKSIEEKFETKYGTSDKYSKDPFEINLTQTGYYAFVVKGGDGGDGAAVASSKKSMSVSGGTGGVVAFIAHFDSGTNIVAYIGQQGTNADYKVAGSAGYVASLGKGGVGNNGELINGIINLLSNGPASGGGGAATSLFFESQGSDNLLCVAAGGGGGGGWNCVENYIYPTGTYVTTPAGMGGNGGGNVISSDATSHNSIFYGNSGTGGSFMPSKGDSKGNNKNNYVVVTQDNQITYGGGGKDDGGTAGLANKPDYGLLGVIPKDTSNSGENYNQNSLLKSGVGGASKCCGGGGGGGYTGGGAGAGTSCQVGAGGGGGGSSYLLSTHNKSATNTTITPMSVDTLNSYLNKENMKLRNFTYKQNLVTITYKINQSKNTASSKTGDDFSMYRITNINDTSTDVKDTSKVIKQGFVYVEYIGKTLS